MATVSVDTKEITVTTRVFTLEVTEEEMNAIRYGLTDVSDPSAARRMARMGKKPATDVFVKLLRETRFPEPQSLRTVEEDEDELEEEEEDY